VRSLAREAAEGSEARAQCPARSRHRRAVPPNALSTTARLVLSPISERLGRARAAESRFSISSSNHARNAHDARREGTHRGVRISVHGDDAEVALSPSSDSARASCHEREARIMSRYSPPKGSAKGTGHGASRSPKGIAESHGGQHSRYDSSAEPTTLSFNLPRTRWPLWRFSCLARIPARRLNRQRAGADLPRF